MENLLVIADVINWFFDRFWIICCLVVIPRLFPSRDEIYECCKDPGEPDQLEFDFSGE